MRFAFIHDHKKCWPVQVICDVDAGDAWRLLRLAEAFGQ